MNNTHTHTPIIIIFYTVNTELIAYFADLYKNYSENSEGKFWVTNAIASIYPLLAPLVPDLLSAPASEAFVERVYCVLSLWLIKTPEKRTMLKLLLLLLLLPFYGPLDFIWDCLGEPVPES